MIQTNLPNAELKSALRTRLEELSYTVYDKRPINVRGASLNYPYIVFFVYDVFDDNHKLEQNTIHTARIHCWSQSKETDDVDTMLKEVVSKITESYLSLTNGFEHYGTELTLYNVIYESETLYHGVVDFQFKIM